MQVNDEIWTNKIMWWKEIKIDEKNGQTREWLRYKALNLSERERGRERKERDGEREADHAIKWDYSKKKTNDVKRSKNSPHLLLATQQMQPKHKPFQIACSIIATISLQLNVDAWTVNCSSAHNLMHLITQTEIDLKTIDKLNTVELSIVDGQTIALFLFLFVVN